MVAELRRKIKEIRLQVRMTNQMMIKVRKIVSKSLKKKKVSKRALNNKRNDNTWMHEIKEICITLAKKTRKTTILKKMNLKNQAVKTTAMGLKRMAKSCITE